VIELLQDQGATVNFNDPYFPFVGQGRHYKLNMERVSLDNLADYDCVVIVTDHSDYDYQRIVAEAQLVVDTRNATRGIGAANVVRC
jgi:UDP-N-acetyl-D-glucosamine dehydrogenase